MILALLLAAQATASPAACPLPPPSPMLSGVTLAIGQGVRAALLPGDTVRFPVAPTKQAKPGTHGGAFAFEVAAAGRYRVSLGAGAWIDVVQGTRVMAAVGHGHADGCSPYRKRVDFALKPGRYVLEVSGSETAVLAMMIAPA
ncbi:MAG TPA: homogentisate 1,2-dioxygenase [Sphingomonas sp.]|jgi:hypothetical protein|nr:homogentisate 1,2-dioxygenase [Sphingomonas sp.]